MFTVGEIRKFGLAISALSEFFTGEQQDSIERFMAGKGKSLLLAEAKRAGTGIGDLKLALARTEEARVCKIVLPALRKNAGMLSVAWEIYAADTRILRGKKTAADVMCEEIEAFIAARNPPIRDAAPLPPNAAPGPQTH